MAQLQDSEESQAQPQPSGLAPDLAATISRKLGGQKVAEQHVSAQTTKR